MKNKIKPPSNTRYIVVECKGKKVLKDFTFYNEAEADAKWAELAENAPKDHSVIMRS